MVNIHCGTAEMRQGKKRRRKKKNKPQDKNIMSESAMQGRYNNCNFFLQNWGKSVLREVFRSASWSVATTGCSHGQQQRRWSMP